MGGLCVPLNGSESESETDVSPHFITSSLELELEC
jgi:hypothetical protein